MQITLDRSLKQLGKLQKIFNSSGETDTHIQYDCIVAIRKVAKSIVDELEKDEVFYKSTNHLKLMDIVKGY